jgi:hypothetical protein
MRFDRMAKLSAAVARVERARRRNPQCAKHHNERMQAVFSGADDAKTQPQRIEARSNS